MSHVAALQYLKDAADAASGRDVEEIVARTVSWAVTHGLVTAQGRESSHRVTHSPVTLLPTPFPKHLFDQAKALQLSFNLLIDRVARDGPFVARTLAAAGAADPFTGRLLDIHKQVYLDRAPRQELMLGLFRADYMVHAGGEATDFSGYAKWKVEQVEINTISSAFAGLSPAANHLHRYGMTRMLAASGTVRPEKLEQVTALLPVSGSEDGFADALAAAFSAYKPPPSGSPKRARPCPPHVLFVVQEGETNTGDQRRLEGRLWDRHRVPAMRRSLQQIAATGVVTDRGELVVDGVKCVVAYFRAGYSPNDYPTEACWQARLMMEKSLAIKCPSIPHHLVGAKKMQQVLCSPQMLRPYCSSDEEVERLMGVFAPIHGLEDTPEGKLRVEAALSDPSNWLLKPQREGGGSLVHGDQMVAMLKTLTPAQRDEYILMRKILPPRLPNILVRDGRVIRDSRCVSELGMFGAVLTSGSRSLHNACPGHLLRTKSDKDEDGGVAAGVAYLDSPFLIP